MVCPTARVGDGDLNAELCDRAHLLAAADMFADTGICIFEEVLPEDVVSACCAAFRLHAIAIDSWLESCGADVDTQFRFNEVVRRRACRYDHRVVDAPGGAFSHPLLGSEAPWIPFVSEVLGEGAVECWRGVVDNRPGSECQGWHRDGQALFSHVHLPAHALVVFVPLVDVRSEALGPTQFYPGSHASWRNHHYTSLAEDDGAGCGKPHCTPLLDRGSMLCFDYRLIHRGLPNTADVSRPMFYIIYAKHWFCITEAEGAFPSDSPLAPLGIQLPLLAAIATPA